MIDGGFYFNGPKVHVSRGGRLFRQLFRPYFVIRCLGLSSLLACAGCGREQAVVPQIKDGVTYGITNVPFRHRWWHYQERGLSWARGGFWEYAETDLRACLRLRQEDSRRARTYGMHFVQCFAHRELGAVLLAQGQLDEAEQEVRLSLEQEPSAKALALLKEIEQARAAVSGGMLLMKMIKVGSQPTLW